MPGWETKRGCPVAPEKGPPGRRPHPGSEESVIATLKVLTVLTYSL
jgi:hypothetical protein